MISNYSPRRIKNYEMRGGRFKGRPRHTKKYVDGALWFFQRSRLYFFILLTLSGCATNTTQRVYQNMALAGAAGAAYGLSKEEYKSTQAVMYGAVGAALVAAITLYIGSPEQEEVKLREEIKTLKIKLDQVNEPKLVTTTPAIFGARIPEKYRAMVQPGEWKVYEMDQWSEDGENRLQHIDKVMEIIPPTLIPR